MRDGPYRKLSAREADDLAPLSPRQRQIAELIADGHTNKVIAPMLGISLSSVETYLQRIVRRLSLDRSKDIRVQLTWLVIDARYEAQPDVEHAPPMPDNRSEAA